MQHDWVGDASLVGLTILFIAFCILVLRRMRARRAQEFAEEGRVDALEAKEVPGDAADAAAEDEAGGVADQVVVPLEERRATAKQQQASPAQPAKSVAEPTALPVEPAARAKPVVDKALQDGLAKTHAGFLGRINALFSNKSTVDASVLDDLEEVLLTADVGVGMATRFIDDLRARLKKNDLNTPQAVRDALRERLQAALNEAAHGTDDVFAEKATGDKRPKVVLFVGVNGVGKTTTIGKIASQLGERGHSVLLAAGDTFRAAAAEQLGIWAERTGARIVRGNEGQDPASVMFSAVESAKQNDVDVVLADTAGRLHTKTELMDEIKKVQRAVGKAHPGAPDETWLVVDATTGQNALQQAREFHQALGLTGIILTKLDGTAKGGVVVAIVDALKIPVRYVGVGEAAPDLRPFSAEGFIQALFQG